VRWLNGSRESFAGQRAIRHGAFGVSESFSFIRRQRAGAQTESDALRPVSSAMASFTEEFRSVFGYVRRVQQFIAHSAFKAEFMPFITAGYHFFGRIHRLAAFRAFSNVDRFERHFRRK